MIDSDHPKLSPAGGKQSPVFYEMAAIFADLSRQSCTGTRPSKIASIRPSSRRRHGTPILFAFGLTLAAGIAGGMIFAGLGSSKMFADLGKPSPESSIATTRLTHDRPVADPAAAPSLVTFAHREEPQREAEPMGVLIKQKATESKLPQAAHGEPRAAATHRVHLAQPAAANHDDVCENLAGVDRTRCMYPEILQTDAALRRAYAESVYTGVDTHALSSVRNRWARLRRRALIDPDQVADGYRQLTRELQGLNRADATAYDPRMADGY